jgi:hypothetical protein
VPSGYVGYGQPGNARLASTSGLRTATIVLFWVATGVAFLVGLLAFARGSTLQDFFDGNASLQDVDDADSAVNGVAGLLFFVELAAVIVLCIWSLRTVRNAKERDPSLPVSPGMACGGWYIPIGNFWLPWQQLRRAGRNFATLSSALTVWQAMAITAGVLMSVGRALGDVDDLEEVDDAVGRLHAQGGVFLALGVVFLIASIFAMKAMKEIDRATSARTP